MEKVHYSKSKFFEEKLPNPFQDNESFMYTLRPLKRLENFSNPFHFPVVLEMKYCSEIDYIIKRVTFIRSSFLDFEFNFFVSNRFMKELFLL